MIDYFDALRLIVGNTPKPEMVALPLIETISHILARDITSPIYMPRFNKSAMDGYALIAKDADRLPSRLKCKGEIKAGDVFKGRIKRGECVKIMTGAPLPEGSDSVVMVEGTRQCKDIIEILTRVKRWENICKRGEDIKKGEVILKKGIQIGPIHIALAATVGKSKLLVFKKPEVAIITTGNEITKPGERLSKGNIYDCNGSMLASLIEKENIRYEFLGIAKDKMKDLKGKMVLGFKKDILLISGGVSMGDYDLVPKALSDFNVKKIFHKINIKPGKPLFFGKFKERLIFGVPGNPVSNLLAFFAFIRPALYKLSGYEIVEPFSLKGILARDFIQKSGRTHFVLTKIKMFNNKFYLYPVSSHGSADIMSVTNADGFMMIDGKHSFIKKGSSLKFISWTI